MSMNLTKLAKNLASKTSTIQKPHSVSFSLIIFKTGITVWFDFEESFCPASFMFQTSINIGYARVSTHKQDLGLEVQMEALKHCDQLFIERESGSNNVRPELEKALKLASDLSQDGKQVIFTIYKLDRLTRSMFKLLELIERFNASDIQLVSLHEKLETDSLIGRLLCVILGFVAESELENLRFRTREGLRKAKENGVKLGAKRMSRDKEERIIELYLAGESSIRTIAKTERISTSTIYKVLERNKVAINRKNVSQNSC